MHQEVGESVEQDVGTAGKSWCASGPFLSVKGPQTSWPAGRRTLSPPAPAAPAPPVRATTAPHALRPAAPCSPSRSDSRASPPPPVAHDPPRGATLASPGFDPWQFSAVPCRPPAKAPPPRSPSPHVPATRLHDDGSNARLRAPPRSVRLDLDCADWIRIWLGGALGSRQVRCGGSSGEERRGLWIGGCSWPAQGTCSRWRACPSMALLWDEGVRVGTAVDSGWTDRSSESGLRCLAGPIPPPGLEPDDSSVAECAGPDEPSPLP